MLRTSSTHPIEIAELASPGGGVIGVTFCPGKHQVAAFTGEWARDLELDLGAIRDWGAGLVVTLVTAEELHDLKVEHLGEAAGRFGMDWRHLPIDDYSVPTAAWERAWARERVVVHVLLDRGGRVLVHCKGGLGRAGMVAARILIERGGAARAAIEQVRAVRRGAIETKAQSRYLVERDIARWAGAF